MERLIMVLVVIACLMVTVANYPDAVEGAYELHNDLFGEE
jgi:hypothetical protein